MQQNNNNAAVIWLTGLPASGKTSIARCLVDICTMHQVNTSLLDGDELRKLMAMQAYDEASRKRYNLEVGNMAASLEREGHLIIAALISPYAGIRDEIRKLCNNFIEVYIATALEVCIQRDPKGLYKKALAGEIKDFTGISAPYEAPVNPELIIDTVGRTPENCTADIFSYYINRTPSRQPA